jgi:hypothetical protein
LKHVKRKIKVGGIEMLTKKQLEDVATCPSHSCDDCKVRNIAGGCCQIAAAKTALAYREMLERAAGVEKTGEEVDEQLIKLLQSDKEELKRWIKRMEYHCNKVNELRIELNKYQKLLKRIESSPKMPIERWTGDEREIICPACKSYICYPEDIKTIDLKYRQFCGACGQKLNWESEGDNQ